jgi:NAD(P)-dependent dehydrogenase (short-subunit alcohol dehydrogenase family)
MAEARPAEPDRRTVVVTGASSGIGAACVERLDRVGWRTFAGVRRAEDADALRRRCSDRVVPLRFDVTDASAVRGAAAAVREATGARLDGLVSNAGIAGNGPVEFLDLDDLRHVMDVNFHGTAAVLQAFLPLVRAARGRVVVVGSMSGRYAAPLHAPYAASKFALRALSDSLRREVRRFGVDVSLVEPGPVETPIWRKGREAADEAASRYPPEAVALYGAAMEGARRAADAMQRDAVPADRVAALVEHALSSRRPKTRYVVGKGMKAAALFLRLAPDRLVDWVSRRRDG